MSKADDDILCTKCGQIMADFLDGEEDSLEHQQIRERVETIPACQACFESYKQTAALCRRAYSARVPEAYGDRLSTFLRKQCNEEE